MTNASIARSNPALAMAVASVSALVWTMGEERKIVGRSPLYNKVGLPASSTMSVYPFQPTISLCENARIPVDRVVKVENSGASAPSWFRRRILSPIGIPLPIPRVLTKDDPALKLPSQCLRRRQNDEMKMRLILEKASTIRSNPERMKALSEELVEVTYGKGVTAQQREDFLIQYGCTGWTDEILEGILKIARSRGIVEIGAGHGQWARALNEAYSSSTATTTTTSSGKGRKQFDFVLAYDDNSNLPLNTHIYNPYTKPHHEYFGTVRKLENRTQMVKVLQSWTCRGRILLLVYPPPNDMATHVVSAYVNAAPEDNDTVIFVGEGRGGANGDDSLFDYFENGEWELLKEMNVRRPPGDKGYEKLFVLRRRSK